MKMKTIIDQYSNELVINSLFQGILIKYPINKKSVIEKINFLSIIIGNIIRINIDGVNNVIGINCSDSVSNGPQSLGIKDVGPSKSGFQFKNNNIIIAKIPMNDPIKFLLTEETLFPLTR